MINYRTNSKHKVTFPPVLKSTVFPSGAFLILLLTYAVQIFPLLVRNYQLERLLELAAKSGWDQGELPLLKAVQEQVQCHWNKHEMNCVRSAQSGHISYILPPAQLLILEPFV